MDCRRSVTRTQMLLVTFATSGASVAAQAFVIDPSHMLALAQKPARAGCSRLHNSPVLLAAAGACRPAVVESPER